MSRPFEPSLACYLQRRLVTNNTIQVFLMIFVVPNIDLSALLRFGDMLRVDNCSCTGASLNCSRKGSNTSLVKTMLVHGSCVMNAGRLMLTSVMHARGEKKLPFSKKDLDVGYYVIEAAVNEVFRTPPKLSFTIGPTTVWSRQQLLVTPIQPRHLKLSSMRQRHWSIHRQRRSTGTILVPTIARRVSTAHYHVQLVRRRDTTNVRSPRRGRTAWCSLHTFCGTVWDLRYTSTRMFCVCSVQEALWTEDARGRRWRHTTARPSASGTCAPNWSGTCFGRVEKMCFAVTSDSSWTWHGHWPHWCRHRAPHHSRRRTNWGATDTLWRLSRNQVTLQRFQSSLL